MKNKRVLSILFFLIILVAVFIYLNKIFASRHFYVNTTEDFKALAKKADIDVIIYGSSHAYTAFNPLIINKKCKTLSFNLGSDALLLSITDLVLDESLKYTKPKLVILEVYKATFANPETESQKGYQLRGLDFVSNFSLKKVKRVKELYNMNEYLGVFSPLIRNHDKWNGRKYSQLSKRVTPVKGKEFFYNGYIGYEGKLKQNKKYQGFQNRPIGKDSTVLNINAYSKKLLNNFIDLAKEHNIEVLLVYTPDIRVRSWNYFFFDELRQFAEKKEVGFLNFNDYYSEMNIDLQDFRDPSHLNISGSIKTTSFLADYLSENYTFSNRSQTESYQESMIVFDQFEDMYYPFEPFSFHQQVDKNLVNDFKIEDIHVEKKKKDKLAIKINFSGQSTAPKKLKNYRLAIHTYPTKEGASKLSERSKSRKILFDISDYLFKSNNDSIELEFDSYLNDIDELEFFLYDKDGYKEIIGNKVRVSNIILTPSE
ncbi:MAG: hypothetical protein ACJASR_001288 [Psychroserpens sp.]|jgi:hypothetical protein